MSAIKDMADLLANLRKKVKDKGLAEDWLRFHDLVQDCAAGLVDLFARLLSLVRTTLYKLISQWLPC
tara:strand:+ start:1578 stop:1778 length:201 start_codon:yes stop_codon:yes gene_type:complete